MDPTETPNPPAKPAAPEEPRPRDLAVNPEPKLSLFGIPVIYIALVLFIIIIILLSWFDLVSGDLL